MGLAHVYCSCEGTVYTGEQRPMAGRAASPARVLCGCPQPAHRPGQPSSALFTAAPLASSPHVAHARDGCTDSAQGQNTLPGLPDPDGPRLSALQGVQGALCLVLKQPCGLGFVHCSAGGCMGDRGEGQSIPLQAEFALVQVAFADNVECNLGKFPAQSKIPHVEVVPES